MAVFGDPVPARWFRFQKVSPLTLKGFDRDVEAFPAAGPKEASGRVAPHPRAQAPVTVRAGAKELAERVTDVSAGGLFVQSGLEVRVGDGVEIELERAANRRRGSSPTTNR